MSNLKLWQGWAIWFTVTGFCVLIYFAQEKMADGWTPGPGNYSSPGEGLDVIILFWLLAGSATLVVLAIFTIGEVWDWWRGE